MHCELGVNGVSTEKGAPTCPPWLMCVGSAVVMHADCQLFVCRLLPPVTRQPPRSEGVTLSSALKPVTPETGWSITASTVKEYGDPGCTVPVVVPSNAPGPKGPWLVISVLLPKWLFAPSAQ